MAAIPPTMQPFRSRLAMAIRPLLRFSVPLLLLAAALPARAQQAGYGQTIGTGGVTTPGVDAGSSRSSSILDSANPIDLMNKLRRATAMDDATPPGDAIDQALKAFDAQPGTAAPSAVPGQAGRAAVASGTPSTPVIRVPDGAVGPLPASARP